MVNFAASYANNGPSAETLLTDTIEAFHGLCFQHGKVLAGYDRALGRSIIMVVNELQREVKDPILEKIDIRSLGKLAEILRATGILEDKTTIREQNIAFSVIEIIEAKGRGEEVI